MPLRDSAHPVQAPAPDEHTISLSNTFWQRYIVSASIGMIFGIAVLGIGLIPTNREIQPARHSANLSPAVVLGSITLLTTLLLCAIYLPMGRRMDQAMAHFRAGRYLLRFTYPDELWRAWVQQQFGKTMRVLPVTVGLGLIVVGVLAWVRFGYIRPENSSNVGDARMQATALLSVAGVLEVILAAIYVSTLLRNGQSLARLPAVCIISRSAIYLHGRITLLDTFLESIERADVVEGSPSFIRFEFITRRSRGMRGHRQLLIPVPPGREELARKAIHSIVSQ